MTTALTCPGRPAPTPAPLLISRVEPAWPVVAGLDPEVALLREVGETTPARLFAEMQQLAFRPLQAKAANTRRGYGHDWTVFVRFCEAAGFPALPATPATLEAFIEWCLPYSKDVSYKYVLPESPRRAGAGVKVSTLERSIAAIGAVHRWLSYDDPTAHPHVQDTFKINARERGAKTPKAPVPYAAIERALPTYGDSLADLRAKALVTTQWSTMARNAELVRLTVEDLELRADPDTPDVPDGVARIQRSKADQKGIGDYRYVSVEARAHLEAWLAAAGIVSGPVFRGLDRRGQLRRPRPNQPIPTLHPNQVALIWKDLARRAGYHPHEIVRIAGHSARIGAAQTLFRANYSTGSIAQDAGWSTEKMAIYYNRTRKARHGAMAQWFQSRAVTLQ